MTRALVRREQPVAVELDTARALAADVISALRRHSHTVSFCESLTAGLASATMASVPGASDVLRGGLVTYATDLKKELAGVSERVLDRYGPVHSVTARHMARGARLRCETEWAVALTGVAGPDDQDSHPVGEVFVAVSGSRRTVSTTAARILATSYPTSVRFGLVPGEATPQRVVAGDRQQIRANTVLAGMLALHYEIGLLTDR